jgi:hypothetical protein
MPGSACACGAQTVALTRAAPATMPASRLIGISFFANRINRSEVRRSDLCAGLGISHTSAAAADWGHNRRRCSGRTSARHATSHRAGTRSSRHRTAALDCADKACVGVRHRRDAERPRDDHGSHREEYPPEPYAFSFGIRYRLCSGHSPSWELFDACGFRVDAPEDGEQFHVSMLHDPSGPR